MIKSKLTALMVAGLLSLGSWGAFAGNDAPIDKGGMPPSTEMNAGSGPENALPPGTIGGGNGGDADGSSTSPKSERGAVSGGSLKGSGAERSKGSEGRTDNADYESDNL
ncbi:hypothetical protein [Pseudomonas sp. C2B4]|uniref:hypothetical protein n=1 Tax=Pseudomonas sp. C2B4 TaxID=2735270 RepID=UPI0015863296|nr:hypothetical protein [Pseudomonas sp. C2B4]NUU39249.1 hypothetical protein [Pseudomonas sp. C2B4]